MCVSVTQFQLCNPMDCSSPGSSVQGILQARVLIILLIHILEIFIPIVPTVMWLVPLNVFFLNSILFNFILFDCIGS